MIRTYLQAVLPVPPFRLLVRDLSTGCAVPASDVQNTLQLVTQDPSVGNTWTNQKQIAAHQYYANQIEPRLCYETVTDNVLVWQRNADYVAEIDPNSSYLRATVGPSIISAISGPGASVLMLRLRMPVTPKTPCSGCSLTGLEQQRYWGVSFFNGTGTIASLSDEDVVRDGNGYATIIVSIGAPQPPNITAANGYTYLGIPAGTSLNAINVRTILAMPVFDCSSDNVPLFTSEDNPVGGFMGEYVPTGDIVPVSQLPSSARPLKKPNTCALVPTIAPQSCTVFYPGT
jgi:hypothetical protein